MVIRTVIAMVSIDTFILSSEDDELANGTETPPLSPPIDREVPDPKDKVDPEFKMRIPKSAKIPELIPPITTRKSESGKILLTLPNLESVITQFYFHFITAA